MINKGCGCLTESPLLGTKYKGRGPGKITIAIVNGAAAQVGAIQAEAALLEFGHGRFGIGVQLQRHPFLTSLGRAVERGQTAGAADRMGLQRPHRIATTQDRRKIVRFLHLLQKDGEVGHAVIKDRLDTFETA